MTETEQCESTTFIEGSKGKAEYGSMVGGGKKKRDTGKEGEIDREGLT